MNPSTTNQRPQAGFSLIELVVVVAIVGLLAGVAYPSYHAYIQKSRRASMQSTMGQLAQVLERGYSKNGQYQAADAGNDVLPNDENYAVNITLTQAGGRSTGFTVTAEARTDSSQSDDSSNGQDCSTMTFDSVGNKTPAACWPN